jgi:hypothetical protein
MNDRTDQPPAPETSNRPKLEGKDCEKRQRHDYCQVRSRRALSGDGIRVIATLRKPFDQARHDRASDAQWSPSMPSATLSS